jgi:predicted DsbA family dithiol-disulfide isomerase
MDALMSKSIPLTIVSDFACPWCLIGKRRLEEAMAQLPDLDILIDWQPFQLNPDMPRSGINRGDYYENKFGAEGLVELRDTLAHAGAESGIVFGNEPTAIAPNTLSAHVLMFWAGNYTMVARKSVQASLARVLDRVPAMRPLEPEKPNVGT